jgi:autotransporter-associated beta strand protein
MPAQGNPVYGAINTALQSPTSPNTYWAGTVGGGIWMTSDGGQTWKPTSDKQVSLAIGALALDSADSSGQTIYAGTGQYSNYGYPFVPVTAPAAPGIPALTGLLKSTNGGTSWSQVASTGLADYQLMPDGSRTVYNNGPPSIDAVIASGNDILVSAYLPYGKATAGGLFRSTNGGASFTLVQGFGTAVTSLTSTTINGQSIDLAARVSDQHPASNAILYSSDGGATWNPILNAGSTIANSGLAFGSTNYINVKVAAGVGGSLFVAVADTTAQVTRLYYTPNFTPGQTPVWYDLGQPKVKDQGKTLNLEGSGLLQANTNFVLTADPNQKGVAYLAGSGFFVSEATQEVAAIFRVNVDGSNASTYTSLVGNGSSPPASPHSDSRSLYFNSSGQLVTTDDGGIYIASSPQSTPTWSAFGGVAANGSPIRVLEAYQAVIDPATGRIAVAAQDNGVALSQSSLTAPWQALDNGDGFSVGINAKTNGPSIFYGTTDDIYLSRTLANTQLSTTNSPTLLELDVGKLGQTYIEYEGGSKFSPELMVLAVNQEDPTKLVLRSSRLYTWQDPQNLSPNTTNILLTDISSGQLFGNTAWAESVAYGTKDAPDAILAGGPSTDNKTSIVYLRTQAQADANQPIGPGNLVTSYTGFDPTNVLFDPRTQQRFFIADSVNLYGTHDLGATMTTLTLPGNFGSPNGLAYILNNGVDALVVGGARTTSSPAGNVIATSDPFDGASTNWQTLVSGMPNTVVQGLSYNASIDTLVAATLGRGVWLLYDVTSNFATANVLQFGLANNDSNPDASLLTDGTVGTRPLIKYGTGTLTITGDATYSGSTTVNGGVLEVDGTLSNTSNVAVNSSGILTGIGTVDPLVVSINAGGAFAPGAAGVPGTSMTIVGNLAFQSGALYLVQLNATATTFANVTGTASLGGTAVAVFASGTTSPAHQYAILQSAGLNGTTFDSLATQNLPNFNASLSYTADDVLLNVTAALGAGTGLNGNQQSVANGLNNFFNHGGTLPANFANVFGLSGPSLANTLSQLSGEVATDAEHPAFNMINNLLNLMLDPSAGGGSSVSSGSVTGFAPEQDESLPDDVVRAYAKAIKAAPSHSASGGLSSFDQRWTAWGSSFGGASFTNGNAAIGSNNVTASDYGFAAGMDYHATPALTYGFGLAGGGTNWDLAQGLGSGRSDTFMAGVYAKAHAGPAYLSAALAFANHWFTTDRTAFGDQLRASFTGQSYAARLEGGYRYAVPITGAIVGVTPYAALQAQDFHTPSYSETDPTGGGFGLSYAAMNATDTRSELGARFDNLQVFDGMPLVLRGRLAWAHDWVTNSALGAAFQILPGSNFVVNGAALPKNSALTTAAAELHLTANWTAIARFDGEFGSGSQTYGGTGTLRYSW